MYHFRQGIKNLPEICVRHGVKKVVIAPGSRNAPLIFAFTSHPELQCLSIADERSAAYFALGLSLSKKEPVALVCTSGTAVLNFAPAIAEAYYQNLPLLVFTADRPSELIDQADGQTLRQSNIFSNYIKAYFQLPIQTTQEVDLDFNDRQISQAIDTSLSYPCGPVQINVPLREPIYAELPATHSSPKIIKTLGSVNSLSNESEVLIKEKWMKYKRKMIVLGVLPKDEKLKSILLRIANEPDVVVIGENLSNVSGGNLITQPESLFTRINTLKDAPFVPDLLITIGNSLISKQLKQFLRNTKIQEHWQMDSSLPYVDTYQSLSTIISTPACELLKVLPLGCVESDFANEYRLTMNTTLSLHEQFVGVEALTDFAVVRNFLEVLPQDSVLHLANSTSVRWTQLFPAREDLAYFCNRGTSGIDGSLSTALGYAYQSKVSNFFLSGDVSFIYDSNGLWNNYVSPYVKIVVLNNNGGNIFRFIGNSELMKNNMEFFTTPHQVNIKLLVEAYGLQYEACMERESLKDKLVWLCNTTKATVLEIFTDPELNTQNYIEYFKHIKK